MSAMKTVTFRGALAVCVSLLAAGCTQPVTTDAASKLSAEARKLEFSYDTTIDQIAHMSCSNMPSGTYDQGMYFTYRVGAYGGGGVALKDSFFDALGRKKPETQSEILSSSPANSDTILQVALRSRTNYQGVYTRTGSAVANNDYANMFTELGVEDVSNVLISAPVGTRVKHIRSGSAGGFRLEGSLRFTDNATLTQATRDFIQGVGSSAGNTGLLAVTYSHGTATAARSIADVDTSSTANATRSVFGRGYIMTFTKPNASPLYSSFPSNVISVVSEQNLDSSSSVAVGSWSCPASMQLRIVRNEDVIANRSGVNCLKQPDPAVMSAELKMVRNTLRVEDWYVDLARRCIIPKKSGPSCYGAVTDIKYNMGDSCGVVDASGASNCVQYASICYRN